MKELAKECKKRGLDFKFIYIDEAHALDTWPIGGQFRTDIPIPNQTKTLDERRKVASSFQSLYQLEFPIYLDDPSTHQFQKYFCSWPLRWYLIDHSTCVYVSQTYDSGLFNLNELKKKLSNYFSF